MKSCLFCRIAAGEIPARVLFSDDELVAFHDIAPQAPVHVLVIPRRHIVSLAETSGEDHALLGRLLLGCTEAARRAGLEAGGFRVVANTGAQAGQSVFHLHFHVLGGRHMRWPPG
ncbi:MAG: histidine triad nucleotide-binding protein [Acidobacteriota bacterium]